LRPPWSEYYPQDADAFLQYKSAAPRYRERLKSELGWGFSESYHEASPVISNRSVPTDTLLPHVVYQDVAEAIVWPDQAFGFSEHYRYGEPGGPLRAHVAHRKNTRVSVVRNPV